MLWPGARDLLFSLKAFAAAMSAFWIACALNLPRPTWAIFTVYVLMQPISGAVRSRSYYRMIGTVFGASIALLLMGLLADVPAALFLSVGLAALLGFFVSMIDQTPRGYVYVMAGITAAVIGLPNALDPLSGFTTAMVRTEEILLGIACATVIDTVFFPHPAGAILNASVAAWLQRAQTYTLNALSAGEIPPDDHEELSALAADAAQLDALAFHVSYDIVPNRPRPRVVRLLHTRMLLLIRLMFACRDWAWAFRSGPGATPRVRQALGAMRDWVRALPAASTEQTEAALRAIDALRDTPDALDAAMALRQTGLAMVLRELLLGHQDCVALQRTVADGAPLPDPLRRAARSEALAVAYRDPLRALLVLLPIALAFLLVFLYWTATGWDQGSSAALMTLVAGLFASTSREPAAQVVRVLVIAAVAAALSIFYQFAVLPGVQGFPLLMVAVGLFLVPAGAFIPITAGTGLLLTVLFTLLLSLQPEYDARFETVADSTLGTLAGLAATAVLAQITRVPGSAWTARHLLRVGWSDLAAIAAGRWHPGRAAYALRALDRFTVLAPQLNVPGQGRELTTGALLGELRIGLDLLRLRDDEPALPAAARDAVSAMRRALAGYFDVRRHGGTARADDLRAPAAAAMVATAAAGAPSAWLMLAGVQRSLFGAAETGDAG
jgi:uncharacterized membrane protein YccC